GVVALAVSGRVAARDAFRYDAHAERRAPVHREREAEPGAERVLVGQPVVEGPGDEQRAVGTCARVQRHRIADLRNHLVDRGILSAPGLEPEAALEVVREVMADAAR